MNEMTKKTVGIRLRPDVWEAIKQRATEENRTANNLVETVMMEYLKKKPKK